MNQGTKGAENNLLREKVRGTHILNAFPLIYNHVSCRTQWETVN